MSLLARRLLLALAFVATTIVLGGFGIYLVGEGRWDFGEGLYMAAISAATVGFNELPGFDQVRGARALAVVIIFLGIGTFAFFQSSLTAFFVEGALGDLFRRNRMNRVIDGLSGHVVVAGCGSTGVHAIQELIATGTPCVVIERNREHVERFTQEARGRLLYVVGDATEDQVLLQAGIARAQGLIAALTHDRDNLYVTLSARTLNAKARIVAKVVELEAAPKMLRAGANATVSPNTIGGVRMASELIRPTVVEFLDQMLRDKERNLRFAEVTVPPRSHVVGRTLREVPIRTETNTLVVAVRADGGKGPILYNPPAELRLEENAVLVVLAQANDVDRLKTFLARTS